jgi:hypothetical protein
MSRGGASGDLFPSLKLRVGERGKQNISACGEKGKGLIVVWARKMVTCILHEIIAGASKGWAISAMKIVH